MSKDPREVLYDSEAALRLVDSALLDMTGIAEAAEPQPPSPPTPRSVAEIVAIVQEGYGGLVSVLNSLRQSRTMLERSAVERIAQTHDKLKEVSAATEIAATDILDGLERAGGLVDELDAIDGATPDPKGVELRARLRDELFALVGHMQFQDITSQQLAYASSVLGELEARLSNLVEIFDAGLGDTAPRPPVTGGAFDPEATTRDRAARQALADDIISSVIKG
jgi:chemotaxis regulatin CheY-phosphate phosphatase CheZ